MSKGSYPAVDVQGRVVGHYVYIAGGGWIYRPLTTTTPWIELGLYDES